MKNKDVLLREMGQGSESAFKKIFDFYWPILHFFSKKFTRSEFLADEVTQEVFIRLWEKRGEVEHVKYFTTYLTTMAKNIALTKVVKKEKDFKRENEHALMQGILRPDYSVDDTLMEKECNELIEKSLNKLTKSQMDVFKKYNEGSSLKKIAEDLGMSYGSAKEHKAKAFQIIRALVAQHLAGFIVLLKWVN